jgi:hypothetical protein
VWLRLKCEEEDIWSEYDWSDEDDDWNEEND